jgi:transposase-like protein
MPRAKPSLEIVQQARELVAAGCSLRDAGETLGVTATTIARWLAAPAPAPAPPASEPPPAPLAAPLPAHMAPPPAVAFEPLDTSDPIELVSQLIREQHAAIQADRASGNNRGAASNAATLERLVKSKKQLEDAARKSADGIVVTSAELARVEDSLRERIKALLHRPGLRCAECNRALSVFWGTGLTESQLDADPAAKPVIEKPR